MGVHFMVGVAERIEGATDADGPPAVVHIQLGVHGEGEVTAWLDPAKAELMGEAIVAAARAAQLEDPAERREKVQDLNARLAAIQSGAVA